MNNDFANNLFDKLKLNILAIIMIAIPSFKLLSYILYLTHIIDDSFLIKHVYILWCAIPILLIIYLLGLYIKKDKINYLDIIMYILAFLALISTIFAVNVKVSIFGEIHRNEGLLTLLSYYLIFLNAKSIKNTKDKKILLKIFIYLGLFQVLYSLVESYTTWGIVKRRNGSLMAAGLCGNPNFFSSYMSMLVMLVSTLYIKTKEKMYLVLTIFYNISLTLAQSSGPFLAVAISTIFLFIYFHKKEYLKRIIIIILTLTASFYVANVTSTYVQEKIYNKEIRINYNIVKELTHSYDQFSYIGKDAQVIKKLGNNRIEIWMNLIPKVKDYWLVGAGIDNINYIYPQDGISVIDKAHNHYLQILLTNGALALILYLIICAIIFIKGFKLKNDDVCFYMLFVVYSIQAFANISVIDVAPYFFLFFGLLASNFNEKLFKRESYSL